MRNKTLFYSSLLIGALAVFGFGCSPQQSPVALDNYKPQNPPQNNLAVPTSTGQATSTQPATTTQQAAATTSTQTQTTQPATSTPNTATSTKPTTMEPTAPLAFPGLLPDKDLANKQIHIKTDKGDIVFELLYKEGPKAASNFYYLVGKKFYDGLIFHRVEPGFVIQGGDPIGNGTGGPGYKFEDDKVNLPYKEGIVAMANAGPNTNGSQFFIMLADTPLPPSYSIFGRVTQGMDVVKKIVPGDKMLSVTMEPLKK